MQTTSRALAVSALLAVSCGATSAQGTAQPHFIGPAVGLTVTSVQTKVDYESTVPSINGQSTQTNDSEAALTASYGFAMSQDWVGTVGFSYGLKSADAGTVTYTAGGTQRFTSKFKDHIVLSFAPGYRVGGNALVYGKLAYHQIKADYTDTGSVSGTTAHTGSGVGFGVAYAIDPKLELRAEYESVTYSAEKAQLTTGTPKQTGLTFGLLYKF